jgi:hypothetical protein
VPRNRAPAGITQPARNLRPTTIQDVGKTEKRAKPRSEHSRRAQGEKQEGVIVNHSLTRASDTDHRRTGSKGTSRGALRAGPSSLIAPAFSPRTLDPDDSSTRFGDVIRVAVAELHDADSPRGDGLNSDHVRVLAESPARLPPILVHHPTMRVVDGMHRLAAARVNGLAEIEARFVYGEEGSMFCLGVKANVTHGLPLSLADRRAAAARIIGLRPELSDRSIARMAGLTHTTVTTIRESTAQGSAAPRRVGADGRVRPLTAAAGRLAASEVIARRPDASLREIAREAGISIGTAQDVRRRVLVGADPVPAGRSGSAADSPAGVHGTDEPRSDAREVDIARTLEILRRDPTLRYSDSGRALLHLLGQHAATVGACGDAAVDIPAHCRDHVGRIAREYARIWTAVAEAMCAC